MKKLIAFAKRHPRIAAGTVAGLVVCGIIGNLTEQPAPAPTPTVTVTKTAEPKPSPTKTATPKPTKTGTPKPKPTGRDLLIAATKGCKKDHEIMALWPDDARADGHFEMKPGVFTMFSALPSDAAQRCILSDEDILGYLPKSQMEDEPYASGSLNGWTWVSTFDGEIYDVTISYVG